MKTGKDLQTLALTLKHAREAARDFVVPSRQLQAHAVQGGSGGIALSFDLSGSREMVSLNGWSHSQLATHAEIPKAYYDKLLKESPELAARNVNHGLHQSGDERRLVRTIDGRARALLSPKYRRLDSADLVDAVLPSLLDSGMEVVSSDLTDRRLYLRATTARRQAEVAKGDVVQLGIMISNSDVGAGSLRVEPFLIRLLCLNGMVMEHALRKAHLGRNLATDADTVELLSDATLRLGEKAFFAEVQDVVRACLEPAMFERQVAKMQAASEQKITNFDLQEVVELTVRKIGLQATQATRTSILEALAAGNQGAGLTKWGLANAFTAAAAGDSVDFDGAVELERAGAAVIDLDAGAWRTVAEKRGA